MDIYKKENYKKEDLIDDQNCIICGLDTSRSESAKSGKVSLCLIKQQIAHLHEKILGCTEDDENSKPRVTLPVDNVFLKNELLLELEKKHKFLLEEETFFDKKTYEEKSSYSLKSMDEMEFLLIETATDLEVMIDELLKCREIAVNVEYYSKRSYSGFTWLLQISKEDKYYMINCLKLQKELHILNTIFMDNKIMKIFHDGENAVLRLHKDLGIFTINMFDTAILKGNVMKSKQKNLVEKKIIFKTNHVHTHCLIYLKDYCLTKLQKHLLKSMRHSCEKICEKVHHRTDWNKINFKNLLDDKVTNRERYIATELLKWRDAVAQKQDESPNFILHDNDIFKIARELLHNEEKTLLQCRGARFLKDSDTYFNISNVVTAAKEVSNNGKNLQWFLDQLTKKAIENTFNAAQVEENNKVFDVQRNQDKKKMEIQRRVKQSKRVPKVPEENNKVIDVKSNQDQKKIEIKKKVKQPKKVPKVDENNKVVDVKSNQDKKKTEIKKKVNHSRRVPKIEENNKVVDVKNNQDKKKIEIKKKVKQSKRVSNIK